MLLIDGVWQRNQPTLHQAPMMPDNSRILTITVGSSSIKFAVFETRDALRRVLEGGIERIGLPHAELVMKGAQPADNFSRPGAAADC